MLKRAICLAALVLMTMSGLGCIDIGPLVRGRMQAVVVKDSGRWFEKNRVALIDVDGFIGARSTFLLQGTTVADVREKLERAAADPLVRAVVLRINSPGGGAGSSDTIYHEVMRFREESGKPVVAAMVGTAASGGYYVSLAADRIVASPNTVTGSVGVIMNLLNVEGLWKKLGLKTNTLKSGDLKDAGSPTRPMTDEERAVLQGAIDDMFGRFIGTVHLRRPGMSREDLDTISDGRIVMADQALKLHMVDRVGYLDDALAEAYALAGIETADVILYRPFPHYNANIYASGGAAPVTADQSLALLLGRRGPAFLYLWAPGAP